MAMLVVTPIGVAAEGNDVDIDMGEGVVFTPGDINNDGNVNLKDLVMIAQYQVGWEVEPVIAALDTNADDVFDLEDVTYLAKHLAGWPEAEDLNADAYVA
ncbi:MAG: hypothetical protein IJC36_00285 [Clostridia bacterium]|nr:hypothetical protein [Clostridia bacterium]